MNLFLPSPLIETSVESLDDSRTIKMCLETAQILSTAIRILDPETNKPVYKMTHKNHPVCVWTRHSFENYKYTLDYFVVICKEYTHRFNKTHKSFGIVSHFVDFLKEHKFENHEQTPFANCTDFKELEVHTAYKKALNTKWNNAKRNPRWTNRIQPEWKSNE